MRPRSFIEHALLLAVTLASAAACEGIELSLTIEPGCCDDTNGEKTFDTRSVKFVHVTVTNFTKTDEETIPVDTGKPTPFQLKDVDRLRPVHVDVLGCVDNTCAQTSDAKFRGCEDNVHVESDAACSQGKTDPCAVPVIIDLDPFDCNLNLAACTTAKSCSTALGE
jgi:hypothetical protein